MDDQRSFFLLNVLMGRNKLEMKGNGRVLTRAIEAVHWLKHRLMQSSFFADDSLLHFKLHVVMHVCLLSSATGSTGSVLPESPPPPVLVDDPPSVLPFVFVPDWPLSPVDVLLSVVASWLVSVFVELVLSVDGVVVLFVLVVVVDVVVVV